MSIFFEIQSGWHIFKCCAVIMHEQLSNFKVTDRQSFVLFLELLRKDFLTNPNGWENNTLDTFLEALNDYAGGIQAYYNNMKLSVGADEPPWQTFADIFKGATMY